MKQIHRAYIEKGGGGERGRERERVYLPVCSTDLPFDSLKSIITDPGQLTKSEHKYIYSTSRIRIIIYVRVQVNSSQYHKSG